MAFEESFSDKSGSTYWKFFICKNRSYCTIKKLFYTIRISNHRLPKKYVFGNLNADIDCNQIDNLTIGMMDEIAVKVFDELAKIELVSFK